MRVFAAIRPPEAALEHLQAGLAPLRDGTGDRLRWLPLEQLHLTVAFYGEVPDGAASDLQSTLAAGVAGSGALQLSLSGAGTFSRADATAPANACCAFCPGPGTGAPCGAYGSCGAAAGACGGTGAPGYCGGTGGVAAALSPGSGTGPPSFGRD